MPIPTMPPSKLPNPRHPFPHFRDKFAPRGWSIFATNAERGEVKAWGVLCASLPAVCLRRHGLTDYVKASPAVFAALLRPLADAIDTHADHCPECARALEVAVWRSLGQEPTKGP